MRILVGWDSPAESELLELYLIGGAANEVTLTYDEAALCHEAREGLWDVVLMTLAFPTPEKGFVTFEQLQHLQPGVPIVLAARPTEMINLPRFLMRGLRFYVFRDAQSDFMFLVLATLESAIHVARAEEARRLAETLRQEIEGVRLLQEAIIPHGLQPPPGYAAAARYEPSQVTVVGDRPVVMAGGDYYDLFCPDGHTLAALIGDASGHGLKACMSIMTMHTLVRMLASERFRDTAAFVRDINDRLCENSIVQSGGGFITLLYATIDTATHTVTWTSAGHPPPLLHCLEKNEVTQVGSNADGGLPLGITGGVEYEAFRFTLPPHSRLLLYSDGLTDAMPEGQDGQIAFGVRGIAEALRTSRDRPLVVALDHLFHASNAYTGGTGRHDDTSVLLLERNGEG
jgi:phosphoserine phosphatase RsbU/P